MSQLKMCPNQIDLKKKNICQFSFQIVLKIKQGYNKNISKLMTFIFRNRTIFWDIPKWNRGQTNWNGGSRYLLIYPYFGWGIIRKYKTKKNNIEI